MTGHKNKHILSTLLFVVFLAGIIAYFVFYFDFYAFFDKIKANRFESETEVVSLEDIDFTKPMIFICREDFSSYISYYGLLKINNVRVPDTTDAGTYSVINTTFMVVDSQDIRFSKIPTDSFYIEDRDGKIPDSWNSINYVKKDLCIWRLVSDVGIGDNEKMYTGCYSWISERIRNGLLDWIFYIGDNVKFKSEYVDIANLQLPVYLLESDLETKTTVTTNGTVKSTPVNTRAL